MKYFTSDHHFWHANIIKLCKRPFSSVEQMNEIMIKRWNDTVEPDDEVYCLGDFSLAARPVETITPRLNGIKYLVPGNHDFCHTFNKKSRTDEGYAKWTQQYEDWGWIVLPEQWDINVPELGNITLCHLPYGNLNSTESLDKMPDKYAKWRPVNEGDWLLCGHVHDRWKFRNKMINVGVDVWDFRPVSMDNILETIGKIQFVMSPFTDPNPY